MRLRKPSPAMLVALMALFVALGGSSYAAITLSNNSVKSKHIAKGNVKRSDIGRNAVNSAKVAAGSLRSSDFAAGQIPAGPQGAQGPQGERGLQGETGAPGTARAYAVVDNDGTFVGNRRKNITAVTHTVGTGTYCLTIDPASGIDTTTAAWVASADWNTSPGSFMWATSATGECPNGQIGVYTFEVDGGTPAFADRSFHVVVP